jgi:2-methylisocitrate lyase-like PEP mutase family enzyme
LAAGAALTRLFTVKQQTMSSQFTRFYNLHHAADLFVLPNVWNAKSALLFQEQQFPAVATSSAAVAESLGYTDGEQMQFADYLFVIQRIVSAVQVPVSVDLETGYGTSADDVYNRILQLIDLGVVGINIEDSTVHTTGRHLKEAVAFAKMIEAIKNRLSANNQGFFINIRCDTYILNVPGKQLETRNRLSLYESTGADGVFLPCISNEEDIADAVRHTRLPLNVMCIPGLPGFDTLQQLGVKRVSMGPFFFNKLYNQTQQLSRSIMTNRDFSAILS